MPIVSVLLPVHQDSGELDRAVHCILNQTLSDLELFIIINGQDHTLASRRGSLERLDPRIRVLHRQAPGLAGALNLGIEHARSPLVARMDSDDTCHISRLELQTRRLHDDASLAGVSCDFEVRSPDGTLLSINRPPRTPNEGAWRLLCGNPYPHGGMLLRVSSLRAAGLYKEHLSRSQDFDLWLRLRRHGGLATVPHTLYTYYLSATDSFSSSPAQAEIAATCLAEAWSELPAASFTPLQPLIALAMGAPDQRAQALAKLEELLAHQGPSMELLLAWHWVTSQLPAVASRLSQLTKLTHVTARLRELRQSGVTHAYLYGAGAHTRWLLEQAVSSTIQFVGILDDSPTVNSIAGVPVTPVSHVPPQAVVILSSDTKEEVLWEQSLPLRDRGIHVHRLYETSVVS